MRALVHNEPPYQQQT